MRNYGPAEKCIYCLGESGADAKLTDEHIIPKSWGGNVIIDDATCEICRDKINKHFENKLARQTYFLMRAAHGVPSTTKDYPKTIPITFSNQAKTFGITKNVSLDIAPLEVLVPYFCLPPFQVNKEKNWPDNYTLKCTPMFGEKERDERWKKVFRQHRFHHGTIEAPGIEVSSFVKFLYKISIGFIWIIDKDIAAQSEIRKLVTSKIAGEPVRSEFLYSAPADTKNFKFFKARVFSSSVKQKNHVFCGIQIFSPLFPEYFCDLGVFEDAKIDEVFFR